MGYTHYWRRKPDLNPRLFACAVRDFGLMAPVLDRFGVQLAGGNGDGDAQVQHDLICFNGVTMRLNSFMA